MNFHEESMQDVIKNIDEVKKRPPNLVSKCLTYDRTDSSWKRLVAVQQCLQNDDVRDQSGTEHQVINCVWNIISPHNCLQSYKFDYK